MSQNFNNYNGAPNINLGSTSQNFDDLSGSLIYPGPPTPVQQNHQQVWSRAPGWQNHSHDNNYSLQYQTPTTDSTSYYSNHQPNFAPFERSKNYYEIDNGGVDLGMSESTQLPTHVGEDNGTHILREHMQPRFPDHMSHPALSRPVSDSQRKARGLNDMAEGPKSKQDTGALTGRAAELRARLLAKRDSTPVASSNLTNKPVTPSDGLNKFNEITNMKTDETKSSTKKIDNMKTIGPISEKTSDDDKTHRPTRMISVNNSSTNLRASPIEKANASTDIDGLLAEGRAAAAAEPTKAASKYGNGTVMRKKSGGNFNESLQNPSSSDKTYSGSRVKGHQRNLNKSTSSSDMSELGEIRSDSGRALGASNAHPESVKRKTPKDTNQPKEQKPSRQALPEIKPAKQTIKIHNGEMRDEDLAGSSNPKSISANKAASSDLLPSPSHDQTQAFKLENHRDRLDQSSVAIEARKESEQDHRRDSDHKERNAEPRRPSGNQPHSHSTHRDRVEHRREIDNRRSQVPRYDVDESARAAAEYKRELEARRQHSARAAAEKSEKIRDIRRKDTEALRPRTPEPKTLEKKRVDSSSRPDEYMEYIPEEKPTKSPSKVLPNSTTKENTEDVRDWLEMTGYFDADYRNTALARFRKIKVLDLQRAELEREAQLEIERRSHFTRSQSAMLRESGEASASGIVGSSILAMPPPPPPRQVIDDIGIKIKDSANREGLPRDTDLHVDKMPTDTLKTPMQTLKRARLDDDPDSMRNQPVEKLSRVESNNRMSDKKQPESPTAVKGEYRSIENRATRSSVRHPNESRARSRSVKSRGRSSSPVHARTLVYDQYIPRHRSRDPKTRRNGYSPGRQSNSGFTASNEKFNKVDTRWCRNCEQPGHTTQNCFKLLNRRETKKSDMPSDDVSSSPPYANNKHDIKKEDDQNAETFGDFYSTESRPLIAHYQQYQPNYYRGRGRGGRGGFSSANNRGGYKSYRPNEGTQDGQQSGGSASLNLEAGG